MTTSLTTSLLQAGKALPATFFFVLRDNKVERVSSTKLFGKGQGRSLLFGMPGAFTPTCSKSHLPSVLRSREAFAKHGVQRIACLTTLDPFVMQAWRESYGELAEEITEEITEEKAEERAEEGDALPPLLMLSDASREATQAFGMEADMSKFGLGKRCLRFATIIDEGVVRWLSAPEMRGECRLSDAAAVLDALAETSLLT